MIMKIYLGIVGSKKVQSFAEEHNCGWCLTPDNARPVPNGTYFLDNGAFTAWKNNTAWNENKFKVLVSKYPNYDFVVAPDIVCGGNDSLTQSCKYIEKIPGPLYLAVQDGMDAKTINEYVDLFDGLFVGGQSLGSSQQRECGPISHTFTGRNVMPVGLEHGKDLSTCTFAELILWILLQHHGIRTTIISGNIMSI
jgi:hypothetical protein